MPPPVSLRDDAKCEIEGEIPIVALQNSQLDVSSSSAIGHLLSRGCVFLDLFLTSAMNKIEGHAKRKETSERLRPYETTKQREWGSEDEEV